MESLGRTHETSPARQLVDFLREEIDKALEDDLKKSSSVYHPGRGRKIKHVVLSIAGEEVIRNTARTVIKPPHGSDHEGKFVEVFTPIHPSVAPGSGFRVGDEFYLRFHSPGSTDTTLWYTSSLGSIPSELSYELISRDPTDDERFAALDKASEILGDISTYSSVESAE